MLWLSGARGNWSALGSHGDLFVVSIDRLITAKLDGFSRRWENDRSVSEDLRLIAETFINLQEQRHGADYDIGYRASNVEVAIVLNRARDAIGSLDRLDPPERQLVAARLIGRVRSA